VKSLPWEPDWLNIKPSRFGSLESLLETLTYCENRGSAATAAGSSNSVSVADNSNCWRRCSTLTALTTLPRGPTMSRRLRSRCRRVRSPRQRRRWAFAGR